LEYGSFELPIQTSGSQVSYSNTQNSVHCRQVAALYSDHYRQVAAIYSDHYRQVTALYSDHYRQVTALYSDHYRQVAALYSDHCSRQVAALYSENWRNVSKYGESISHLKGRQGERNVWWSYKKRALTR
jgi:predicted ATP-grasp superfamily ATP-dependent carboligase